MTFLLSHSLVEPESKMGRQVAFILHGALGSGQNFRGIARALTKRVPYMVFVLVDLRNHGGSAQAPSPQTLRACATDLQHLRRHLMSTRPDLEPVSCLIGHSFGGKVAIEYAQAFGEELSQVWVLDSNPGPQAPDADHEIATVIRAVRAVPEPITTRAAAVASLLASGISQGTANWMTTNLKRVENHYEWVFNLDAIEELLIDYFSRDLWPFLEQDRTGPAFKLVVAENSDRWVPSMKNRALALGETTQVSYHVIEKAGHWLHVDNPGALLGLMAAELPRPIRQP